ncbi:prolyl oligopeptidase family serine peptidase [Nocardia sp. JMUB6875]|uniref:poly(ethylene terephthalate) hydrolase family protein n=1 Tax=Nocardia sp. JMUB6875 TaxID=3158170 RepID=UPI0034E8AA94
MVLAAGLAAGLFVAPTALAQPPGGSSQAVDDNRALDNDGPKSFGPFERQQRFILHGADPGFEGGTVWFPKQSTGRPFPTILVMPGFLAFEGSVSWFGPLLASYGFLVLTMFSKTPFDSPVARNDQMAAAVQYLGKSKDYRDLVDTNQIGMVGWSYGGDAALHAAALKNPLPKAVVAFAPSSDKAMELDYQTPLDKVRVPAMMIGIDDDILCLLTDKYRERDKCALPAYRAIGGMQDKMFVQLSSSLMNHFEFILSNPVVAAYTVAWLIRFVQGRPDYNTFLCGGRPAGVAEIRSWLPSLPCAAPRPVR